MEKQRENNEQKNKNSGVKRLIVIYGLVEI